MKGGCIGGLRGKQFSLVLITLCTVILIWAWDNTPILQSWESLDMVPRVPPKFTEPPLVEKEFSYVSVVEHPTGTVVNDASVSPVPFVSNGSIKEKEEKKHIPTTPEKVKECNYAKGRWVADKRGPLYSGFGCKQWLSEAWACRLTQRTNFSYENFRWQPAACELPEFDRSKVLRRMQGKTIAFVGDSLGRQQFQSMMCMLSGGEETNVEDVGINYGLVKAPGAKRPEGWAYRFRGTNTTVLYYWSSTLADLEPINKSDPHTKFAMHLDRPVGFLKRFLHMFDILVLNTGHHWNRGKLVANKWEMYLGGKPNTDRKIAQIWNAKNHTIVSVVEWLDSQLPRYAGLKAFFRTISPRHFFHGDWDTGGSCDDTSSLAHGYEVVQDRSLDPVVEAAVKGRRVKILDITAISDLRDEGHISRYSITASPGVQDCLHWCLPGIPDTWNEILFAQV